MALRLQANQFDCMAHKDHWPRQRENPNQKYSWIKSDGSASANRLLTTEQYGTQSDLRATREDGYQIGTAGQGVTFVLQTMPDFIATHSQQLIDAGVGQ